MRKVKCKADRIILLILFAIYLIVLFKITIFRDSNSGIQSVNLVPFITITQYYQSILGGNKIVGISNLLGNLIIFFPLGYIPSLSLPEMRKFAKILLLALSFSLFIEVFQYVFACGRADIDDVILNTLGGVVGYWIYILTSKLFTPKKYAIFISVLMIAFTCVGFIAVNSYRFFFISPTPDNIPMRTERHNKDFIEPFQIDGCAILSAVSKPLDR